MAFQTEVEFTLPKGYLDGDGVLHREGVMRLATAADEILPLKDPRVRENPAYLTIIVLARVVTRLGALPDVNTRIIEGLFASDLSYLRALYESLNGEGGEEASSTLFERTPRETGIMGAGANFTPPDGSRAGPEPADARRAPRSEG